MQVEEYDLDYEVQQTIERQQVQRQRSNMRTL